MKMTLRKLFTEFENEEPEFIHTTGTNLRCVNLKYVNMIETIIYNMLDMEDVVEFCKNEPVQGDEG